MPSKAADPAIRYNSILCRGRIGCRFENRGAYAAYAQARDSKSATETWYMAQTMGLRDVALCVQGR